MTTIPFGIIGCGLMGRELASAMARWFHLAEMDARAELVAVCDRNDERRRWLAERVPSVRQSTADYRELLANPEVEAVYCAVPHNLHQEIYCAIIGAGRHLLGEKPFGIDRAANDAILACAAEHPRQLVRCSSEFAFYPAAQRIMAMIEAAAFGRIIEVNTGFLHSSDLDPDKPINWKRLIEVNGEYGVMGDLGLHACHVPFRAGWLPRNVRAVLSDIVKERPDGRGGRVPCRTWDNATLLCETAGAAGGDPFPWTIRLQRIAPGEKNTWYIEIKGTKGCARFSTKNPKLLETLYYAGGEQSWQRTDIGYEPAFKAITGGLFEFGFSDACLQMLAAFAYEAVHGRPFRPAAGCLTPGETALSHRLFTAALESHRRQATVGV
jgi:predicted dehydrogenase